MTTTVATPPSCRDGDSQEITATSPGRRPLTVRPAPRREPPFDDETEQLPAIGPQDQLPFVPWPGRLHDSHPWHAPRPTGRVELPDAGSWARRLIVAVLEVRAGRRSLQQLMPHLSASVHHGIAGDLARHRLQPPPPVAVRSVLVCEPADGIAEIAAVIQYGHRYRAVAARLEGLDGRWRCVRLQIG